MFGRHKTPMDERYLKMMAQDPRYQLGMNALSQGSSTAPVSGAYDGIARALQGVMGGVMAKNAGNKFYDAAASEAAQKAEIARGMGLAAPAPGTAIDKVAAALAPQPVQPPNLSPGAGMNGATPPIAGAPPANPMMASTRGGIGAPANRNAGSTSSVKPSAVQYADFKKAIIGQETGGRYGVPNAEGSGAMGIGQVMPDTAKALAKRIGLSYRPDLMAGTSPEAQQYQDAITEAAVQEAWKAGKGDPRTAGMYYFGGSDRSQWLDKTRKYGDDIVARLGGVSPNAPQSAVPANGALPAVTPAPTFDVQAMPELPGMPKRPEARPAPQSGLLEFGRRMLETGDQAMMAEGMNLVDRGLQERMQAEREAIAREYGLDTDEYRKALDNRYGAEGDIRGANLNERRDSINANRASRQAEWNRTNQVGDMQWERGNTVETREDEQQHDIVVENVRSANNLKEARMRIDASIEAARAKATLSGQSKLDNFFNTPQGQKFYGEAMKNVQTATDLAADVTEFTRLNKEQATGNALDRAGPIGRTARSLTSDEIQRMNAITEKLAPMQRQAGSGAMSDRDVEMYRASVPHTMNTREANEAIAARIVAGTNRVRDYEIAKLKARGLGEDIEFAESWGKYTADVGLYDDNGKANPYVSYDDWKEAATYDRKGRRVK